MHNYWEFDCFSPFSDSLEYVSLFGQYMEMCQYKEFLLPVFVGTISGYVPLQGLSLLPAFIRNISECAPSPGQQVDVSF